MITPAESFDKPLEGRREYTLTLSREVTGNEAEIGVPQALLTALGGRTLQVCGLEHFDGIPHRALISRSEIVTALEDQPEVIDQLPPDWRQSTKATDFVSIALFAGVLHGTTVPEQLPEEQEMAA